MRDKKTDFNLFFYWYTQGAIKFSITQDSNNRINHTKTFWIFFLAFSFIDCSSQDIESIIQFTMIYKTQASQVINVAYFIIEPIVDLIVQNHLWTVHSYNWLQSLSNSLFQFLSFAGSHKAHGTCSVTLTFNWTHASGGVFQELFTSFGAGSTAYISKIFQ
jgi:hypothetical protein